MNRSFGLENEKTFVDRVGNPDALDDAVFSRILEGYKQHAIDAEPRMVAGRVVGIQTMIGYEGIDGSFNIGESSTEPISEAMGGLTELDAVVNGQLAVLQASLEDHEKAIINMSNSPLIISGEASTRAFSLPRPGSYAREVRNWQHEATLHGQVQNSPSTSIRPEEVAPAVNALIGFGSAFIGMYANSPFSEQRVTSDKEHRLRLWDQYFGKSIVTNDSNLPKPPSEPFENTKDYFEWIYGEGTSMFCIYRNIKLGDVASRAVLIPQTAQSLHEFVGHTDQEVYTYPGKNRTKIIPLIGDVAANQFMQFAGVRLRFRFKNPEDSAEDYVQAFAGSEDDFNSFMDSSTSDLYVENRDPGANFADQELNDQNPDAARSVVMSESAIQAGIINNLEEATQTLEKYDWTDLMELREHAIRHGIHAERNGVSVLELANRVIDLAESGLPEHERWMLEYPRHVVRTKQAGADRALSMYERSKAMTERARIREVCMSRIAVRQAAVVANFGKN